MHDALLIFRKEIRALVKDKRTLFSTFILPLLMMPIIFIGMGSVLGSIQKEAVETIYRINIEGTTDRRFFESVDALLDYQTVSASESSDVQVLFPDGFVPGNPASIRLVYDSSSQKIQYAAQQISTALQLYDRQIAALKLSDHGLSFDDLTTLTVTRVDLAPEEAQSGGSMLAMMVPYFLIIFLFAGSMSSGMDVTAGEKERGSLAALLVNQVSRTSIAMGKILHVMTVSTLSAITTFLGLLISMSLPNGTNLFGGGGKISIQLLSFNTLGMILLGLLSTALFTAALVTLLGSLAKSVKEANTYVMPMYLVVVLVGVMTMYMDPSKNVALFFVPYVNTIFVFKEVFMGMGSILHVLIAFVANLAYAAIGVRLVSLLFNSEKILQTV